MKIINKGDQKIYKLVSNRFMTSTYHSECVNSVIIRKCRLWYWLKLNNMVAYILRSLDSVARCRQNETIWIMRHHFFGRLYLLPTEKWLWGLFLHPLRTRLNERNPVYSVLVRYFLPNFGYNELSDIMLDPPSPQKIGENRDSAEVLASITIFLLSLWIYI